MEHWIDNVCYQEATFIKEEITRFVGRILLNNNEERCYIPFSSKLSKHIPVENRTILVKECETKSGLKYELFAIKVDHNWHLIDLRKINKLVHSELILNNSEVIAETTMQKGYRADFSDQANVWEVKALLSQSNTIEYPAMKLDRANKQLESLLKLQADHWNIKLLFVLLNPNIETLTINKKHKIFHEHFEKLTQQGMEVLFFKLFLENTVIRLEKTTVILYC